MALFKRILQDPPPAGGGRPAPGAERRRVPRFAIAPQFPLKAVLSYVGRDDTGAPMSSSRHGWHWKGRLIDCSELGARIQLGHALRAIVGESCDLRLSVQGFEIEVPCHVTNIRDNDDGLVVGLRHQIEDPAVLRDYRQLVDVVALASTLRLRTREPKPDDSGYLVERYASARPSCLTIWRHPHDGAVWAFEFIMKDSMVRAMAGRSAEYFSGGEEGAQRASAARCLEIHRLFTWVVANLPTALPDDVRNFLQRHAS